jgi:hypothetical protein
MKDSKVWKYFKRLADERAKQGYQSIPPTLWENSHILTFFPTFHTYPTFSHIQHFLGKCQKFLSIGQKIAKFLPIGQKIIKFFPIGQKIAKYFFPQCN